MLNLTEKALDALHRDMYLINSENARKQLAKDIKEKLKYMEETKCSEKD